MRVFPPYKPGWPEEAEGVEEIGRTVTDDYTYFYFENGLAVRQHRPSTRSEYFHMTAEEIGLVRHQFKKPAPPCVACRRPTERHAGWGTKAGPVCDDCFDRGYFLCQTCSWAFECETQLCGCDAACHCGGCCQVPNEDRAAA